MCELCRQTPCHPRCPNADEPRIFGYCTECDEPLTVDYEAWIDNEGNTFCSTECAMAYHEIRVMTEGEIEKT